MDNKKAIPTKEQVDALLGILEQRFEKYKERHPGVTWEIVRARLESNPEKLRPLYEMEETGGEPDVTGYDESEGTVVFCDCAVESPKGRRSICYDPRALASRKEHKPKDSAMGMAAGMGIELLDEEEYFVLQKLGTFDTKTSSWIKTPDEVRANGGALFGDKRYGRVFIYHNGAESYYAARGFRGILKV